MILLCYAASKYTLTITTHTNHYQWFHLLPILSYFQIQKCLVKLGDKPKDFIDSKQWIGSTEVGYVLEESTKIQSMFLSVSSGEELASKGRELSQHFKKHGTPVMIGRLF